MALLHSNGEISVIQIKPKEINKIANITRHKAHNPNLKFNPVADMELRVENGVPQIIVVEGEGTVSIYGVKKE